MGNPFYDIIYIGEIAKHISVIINLNRLAVENLIGKLEVSHIRPAKRSVNRKETKPGSRNPVEVGIRICHKLVRLFRCRIKADWAVRRVIDREWNFFLISVNRRTRCKKKMLYRIVAASFQDVEETHDVGLYIRIRMIDAVADSGLCGKINDNSRFYLFEEVEYHVLIGQVSLYETIVLS